MDDLRAFRKQVLPELDYEYPQPPAPAATQTRWRRFVEFLSSLSPKSPALVFGSALATLLIVAAGWLIWRALERNERTPKLAQETPSPTTPDVTPFVFPQRARDGSAAMVIAQLNDGDSQVRLNASGELSGADHLPPDYQQRIKDALTSQRLEKSPLLAGLIRPDGSLRKGGGKQGAAFSVIDPAGIVLFADRPTFRWSPLADAAGYIVEVYDDKLNQIMRSSQLAEASWTPPQSLQRGGIYSWQVTALKGGEQILAPRPPAPPAKFRILDESLAKELVRARRDFASSHLMLALLYTRAGLLDEAEREFRALQRTNPNSPIPRRLLADLRAMRR